MVVPCCSLSANQGDRSLPPKCPSGCKGQCQSSTQYLQLSQGLLAQGKLEHRHAGCSDVLENIQQVIQLRNTFKCHISLHACTHSFLRYHSTYIFNNNLSFTRHLEFKIGAYKTAVD